jgi:hypothetical protein
MNTKDWMPSYRGKQIDMAGAWTGIVLANKELWRIFDGDIEKLQAAYAAASSAVMKPEGSRSKADNAEIKAAMNALVSCMRYIKRCYFHVPPLTDADLIRLGLRPKDEIPTPVPAPTGQAEVSTQYGGTTQLYATVSHLEGTALDPKTVHGYKLAFMLCDADQTPPASGKELSESRFSRRKKFLLNFEPEDKGKKVYFSARYENSKGEAGPWVPVTSAVVPF